jgi:hypothetical protein
MVFLEELLSSIIIEVVDKSDHDVKEWVNLLGQKVDFAEEVVGVPFHYFRPVVIEEHRAHQKAATMVCNIVNHLDVGLFIAVEEENGLFKSISL